MSEKLWAGPNPLIVKAGRLPMGLGGATFGPIGFVNEDANEEEISHETRHGKQFSVPGWSLLKMLEMFYGQDKGPLEQDAYRHATPTNELVAKPGQEGLINALAQKYIRWNLGE